MTTANFESWGGQMLDIGPIYPFVGSEVFLFILGLIFWIGWHVLQFRVENREFEEDKTRLSATGGLSKRLEQTES